jgi:serine protease Do
MYITPQEHPRPDRRRMQSQTEYAMPTNQPFPTRASGRAPLLATAAVLGLLAGGGAVSLATAEAPAPANAQLSGTNYANPGYADLVQAVKPAVVNVRVEKAESAGGAPQGPMMDPEMRRFFERFFGEPGQGPGPMRPPVPGTPNQRERGEGSGFVVSADGLIVTNAHVAGGADKITILFDDGTEREAKLRGIDEKTDLALLKVEADKPLPYVTFGDSSKVRVGDAVVAVGNPFGLGGTVTAGIVSATGREIGSGPYDDFLQVDAPINRGNSGGPTFNLQGEVVGVNSAIFSPSGGSVGIGFAISSNLAKEVIADLQDDGRIERGWLGVQIQGLDEDLAANLGLDRPRGALVSEVQKDSPAAAAGVRQGDVILSFAGKAIEQVRQLSRAVADVEPGSSSELVVWRDGNEVRLQAAVGQMPGQEQVAAAEQAAPGSDQPRLGLALAAIPPERREQLGLDGDQQGVLVTEVVPGGPADAKGLRAGDVILSIDRQPVGEPADVVAAIRKAHEGGAKSVLLYVAREGNERFEAVPLVTS